MKYIVQMDLKSTLRLLLGTLRPFIVRKAVHAVRERLLMRRVSRMLPTPVSEGLQLEQGLLPLPSAMFFEANSLQIQAFAQKMRHGEVESYGIENWRVGQPDPECNDIRSVHELSRMHHWCAYALTAHIDDQHSSDWCELLRDEIVYFIQTVKPLDGTHWAFPMGTSIRLYSMLVAWDWACQTGFRDADAERLIAASAVDHALLSHAQRESRGGLSTSHYLANLLALAAATAYIHGSPHRDQWRKVLEKEVFSELSRQILPDGLTNEASTGYHRQIVDLAVHTLAMLNAPTHSIETPQKVLQDVQRAVHALYTLESIGMPLIGDNDDGLAMKVSGFQPSTDLLFDTAQNVLGLGVGSGDSAHSSFPDFGLDIYRGFGFDVTLRNGPYGQYGKGGHAHNDQNSITISYQGELFVTDTGSSTYSGNPRLRNEQRSVHSHSTMWSPGHEQAQWPSGYDGLFWLFSGDVKSKVVLRDRFNWKGIARNRSGIEHSRTFGIENSELSCLDQLAGTTHGALVFVIAPHIRVELENASAMLIGERNTLCISWIGPEASLETIHISQRFASTTLSKALLISAVECSWKVTVIKNN